MDLDFGQLDGAFQPFGLTLENLLPLAISSAFFAGLVFIMRYVVLRLLARRAHSRSVMLRWRFASLYISIFICFFFLAPVWLSSLSGLLAVLGIFGAGIMIVSKEPILNIWGWFYIMMRRPFQEGHRIKVGDHIGDVLEVRLQSFSMIEVNPLQRGGQSTGRVIQIPNSLLFTLPVTNSSKEFSFIWNEILVPLKPGSDWKRAAEILRKIAEQSIEKVTKNDSRIQASEEKYAIQYTALQPAVFIEYKDGAILLYLRHLTEPRRTRLMTDAIWREVLTRFAKEKNIQLSEISLAI